MICTTCRIQRPPSSYLIPSSGVVSPAGADTSFDVVTPVRVLARGHADTLPHRARRTLDPRRAPRPDPRTNRAAPPLSQPTSREAGGRHLATCEAAPETVWGGGSTKRG